MPCWAAVGIAAAVSGLVIGRFDSEARERRLLAGGMLTTLVAAVLLAVYGDLQAAALAVVVFGAPGFHALRPGAHGVVHDGPVDAARPTQRLLAGLAAVAALIAVTPATAQRAAPVARVQDDAGVLSPDQRVELDRQASTVAVAGAPVLVELRTRDEDPSSTIADARALMTADDVESAPGAHDGVVLLANLQPGGRHGTAAIVAGEALLHGRLPQSELQRIYDQEMAPRLRSGDVAAAVDGGLVAVARDLREGPPAPPPWHRAATVIVRFLLDPTAILLLLAVTAAAVRERRRRHRLVAAAAEVPPAAPDEAPPAVAGALWQAHLDGSLVRATLLDLARRGALRVEGGKGHLRVRCVDAGVPRSAWERHLWSALARAADREGWVSRRRLADVLQAPRGVLRSLRDDLREREWFERSMAGIRRPLYVRAVVAVVAGALVAGVAGVAQEPAGWLGVASATLAAAVALAVAVRLPEVTPAGGAASAPWAAYRRSLQAALWDPGDRIDWDRHLAHAVALRLDRQMRGRLLRDGRAGYVPDWADLRDRDQGGGFDSLWVAFDSTGHGGGSSGGGDGGAGAGADGAGGSF